MSILIKGTEMPITCCHCPLMGYDPDIEWNDGGRDAHGAYICVLTHELIDNTKREEHCPLIELPPHGRLIEDIAVREQIDEWLDSVGDVVVGHGLSYYGELLGCIEDAPTIIPAEKEGET